MKYDHKKIEEKWMKVWEEKKLFWGTVARESERDPVAAKADQTSLSVLSDKENSTPPNLPFGKGEGSVEDRLYLLFAFAYPSGEGLHVGHVEAKAALDILARFYRMQGKRVFLPVGWDAFGLPAENYAVKTGVPPAETTKKAIENFKKQIKRIGISYDWEAEISTAHPGYYKWTQWLFVKLYEQGLAYQAEGKVNWCPSCQTVLANEQVVNGRCERCDSEVVQKKLKQWYFRITDYVDELVEGLEQVDWPEATKRHQLDWIGKAKGLNIDFQLEQAKVTLTVWTKFWETVFGATYVVIAPEKYEELGLAKYVAEDKKQQVEEYVRRAMNKTDEERKIGEKDKTGVDTGLMVVNPVNGEAIPLYVADYVLVNVGTGVVMGVPAHDERDFAFAKKFDLPIRQVVAYEDREINEKVRRGEAWHEDEGELVNSGEFEGMNAWGEGKEKMAEWMIGRGCAEWNTTYKLRDWLISRQRYWGAPMPIVYDPEGKAHVVKEEHLPWLLPTDVEFKPTGESPLRESKEFQERVERLYGKGWTPEYDTLDTFVDSAWYFLRYVDARNEEKIFEEEKVRAWLPVDMYMIGPEHIVLHLLYARFITKFLRDQGYLNFDEPFAKMRHQGMILGPDNKKMSKSKGNVINPDEIVEQYGADTLRVYEMFMGPLEADKPWNPRAVSGVERFLKRFWKLIVSDAVAEIDQDFEQALHRVCKQMSEQLPQLKFNTAIAALMELVTLGLSKKGITKEQKRMMVRMLAPLAPFMTEELWQGLAREGMNGDPSTVEQDATARHTQVGESDMESVSDLSSEKWSVHEQEWPKWDPTKLVTEMVLVVMQVNGKKRGEMQIEKDVLAQWEVEGRVEEELVNRMREHELVSGWLEEKQVVKVIWVAPQGQRQGLVNVVVR